MAKREFRIEVARALGDGEYVSICGSVAELGSWDANRAIGLSECACCTYGMDLTLPIDQDVEYKYVLKNNSGATWWENGANRVLHMSDLTTQPSSAGRIQVHDDGNDDDGTKVVRLDPWLKSNIPRLRHRWSTYCEHVKKLTDVGETLDSFSRGYEKFGFTRGVHPTLGPGIYYREWAPGCDRLSLVGDFNHWNDESHVATRDEFGWFELFLPDVGGHPAIAHQSLLKVCLTHNGVKLYRIPTWIKRSIQEIDPATNKPKSVFTGQYWDPPTSYEWTHPNRLTLPDPSKGEHALRIYEAHVGMASSEGKIATYREFACDVVPRVKALGYNTIQLMAIMEHAYYGSFGYHVTNFFAVSSRFGTPEDLKFLVDTAHGHGLRVIMDMVHSHACKNTEDGLNMFDGTDYQYFHAGPKGEHSGWDSRLFDYGKLEVQRFLLSNLRWYIEEYHFDGYRFDGVTSMLYTHHGLTKGFSGHYDEYFGSDVDIDAVTYLMMGNQLLHSLNPPAITIGEDVSGMPTLCRPVCEGGVGFDYRLGMAIPDMWIKLLKDLRDDEWDMDEICKTLLNRRYGEKTVAYVESHDQALVGDKTTAFWLMDKEMYDFMAKSSPDTPIISRGLALHKMLRAITYSLGGEGYLNFMGNEFGHPEWIDFPRAGNNESYHYCRRQWNLVYSFHPFLLLRDNKSLRYHFLSDWDHSLHQLEDSSWFMGALDCFVSLKHNQDKLVVYEKGNLVWVFNFHPTTSFTDYKIGVPRKGRYLCVLDSDDVAFGGYGRIDHGAEHWSNEDPWNNRPCAMFVYAPCRTVAIYKCDGAI